MKIENVNKKKCRMSVKEKVKEMKEEKKGDYWNNWTSPVSVIICG